MSQQKISNEELHRIVQQQKQTKKVSMIHAIHNASTKAAAEKPKQQTLHEFKGWK